MTNLKKEIPQPFGRGIAAAAAGLEEKMGMFS